MTKKKPISNLKTILIALSTLILGFIGGQTYQGYQEVKVPSNPIVARVIDGDTLELDNGQSVRLYGVNCPEKNQPLFQEATDLTTKLTLNQPIRIEYQPNYQKDRWGRVLGYVFIGDTHLNEELVKQGLCEVIVYQKRAKLIYQDELLQAQEEAKRGNLGKWKE